MFLQCPSRCVLFYKRIRGTFRYKCIHVSLEKIESRKNRAFLRYVSPCNQFLMSRKSVYVMIHLSIVLWFFFCVRQAFIDSHNFLRFFVLYDFNFHLITYLSRYMVNYRWVTVLESYCHPKPRLDFMLRCTICVEFFLNKKQQQKNM